MSLLKYLKRNTVPLPKDNGDSSTKCANEEVMKLLNKGSNGDDATNKSPRGKYLCLSPVNRFKIGKHAAENGTPSAIRLFKSEFPTISESTVRRLKGQYLVDRKRKLDLGDDSSSELPTKKPGRPLLLGHELDSKVQVYLEKLMNNGGVVNTAIVRACGRGIVQAHDKTLLTENGGLMDLTRNWALSIMNRMHLVKRRGTTAVKAEVKDFDERKSRFLERISSLVSQYSIPPQLVINWDQTGISIVPVSSWTMATEGAKRVDIRGLNDKRQITGVLAGSQSGAYLPVQLIYQGKTSQCHPKFPFPDEWNVTHSPNHWSTSETMMEYIEKILIPYTLNVKDELDLPLGQKTLVIFDVFRAQITEEFREKLKEKNFVYATIPPCCTDELQPMDLSVNKAVKDFMHDKFQEWYGDQVMQQMQSNNDDVTEVDIDLSLTRMKNLSAK